jgi:dihydropteroate synthase
MPFGPRSKAAWKLRTRTLDLGERTAIMGVLNVTPDSFSDGDLHTYPAVAVQVALRMLDEGADVIDIGGESTRPGSYARPTPAEEADRVLPVIEGICKARPSALLSIDTYHASTARLAVAAGAEIVNDVSGFLWDPAMAATCAELACGVVLMHTRGKPWEWKSLPPLRQNEVLPLVLQEMAERIEAARHAGIESQRLVLDPGFGFGKAFDENYTLLSHLDQVRLLGFPVLAGVSRKGFLGRTLAGLHGGQDAPASDRGSATLAATTAAILNGADIVRVHDVKPAAEAAAIADAILAAS